MFRQYGLLDEEGQSHAALIGVDRYGTVESYAVAPSASDFPDDSVVLEELSSAENACPECGVPEAQWEASQE